jgi:SAM-dependent methyltransferase
MSLSYTWDAHGYTDFYQMLFCNNESKINSVFECGIGTSNLSFPANMGSAGRPGASLRVWRDYFPNAVIYGADIDHDVLFIEERIETFYMNQLDPFSIKSATQKFQDGVFDFMVDDGLHTYEAALTLFLNSNRLLSPGGVYVIEDVTPKSMRQLLTPGVIPDSFVIYPVTFHEVGKSQELNSLLVITRASASLDNLDQR